ncbi:imidazolonepropionase [Roseobacter sp.]|uniref:imidazolonepropionase n=1 Tax=Roseobacter sp. TaxID=1907202 RepID=UPI0029668BF9|nr:imidazolonepropionase [Roseobacter sp.]MDW3183137.1 imidazolonepropionase [Roseobacter sp.]
MLIRNTTVATLARSDSFGLIEEAVVALEGAQIAWVGPEAELPDALRDLEPYDAGGRLVTPALIDCHTHVVFGGNRASEFELRLKGASYEEIAQAGGGIVSTVAATRGASDAQLLADALTRVDALMAEGVTLIEVKSGYGLDLETELKMLRVARAIADERPIEVRTSFLGAHAIPAEYAGDPDRYLEEQCLRALKAAHAEGLVDAVDGFCEGIAFNTEQIARVFDVAQDLGLPVKLHAEQLSRSGGAQLAAHAGALSADHLEYATDADVQALEQAGTVAVLLPGAFYTLRETQRPPVQAFRDQGVAMALATDCNPGSSPMTSLLLAMNMGCTLFRMTPLEALLGVTAHAARALGMTDRGRVVAGMRADVCIWDVQHPAELAYRIGFNPLHARFFNGAP